VKAALCPALVVVTVAAGPPMVSGLVTSPGTSTNCTLALPLPAVTGFTRSR
jgi:hypothetical protein